MVKATTITKISRVLVKNQFFSQKSKIWLKCNYLFALINVFVNTIFNHIFWLSLFFVKKQYIPILVKIFKLDIVILVETFIVAFRRLPAWEIEFLGHDRPLVRAYATLDMDDYIKDRYTLDQINERLKITIF